MKIAFIVSSFPTISETFILNQITGLIGLGHDVDIFAFWKPRKEKVHKEIIEYDLLKKTTYFNIPKSRFSRLLKSIRVFFRYFISYPRQIIRCIVYTKHHAISALIKLVPFLRKKYDVVHCHFGPNGNEIIFLKDIFPEVRFITTFHGYDITQFLYKNTNGVYKDLFKKCDLFMPISNLWKERLERLGCPREKIIVQRMGVDTERITIKEKFQAKNEVKIITVARLVEKKGLKYSISAVARVIKKYPKVTYYIVGDGDLKKELMVLISQLGLDDKIKLLGSLENNKVKELMKESDIFLLTSVTSSVGDMEGIPVSLMEAMATGLPVISTYHSGIPELVEDGKSGFLVPEKNVDALVEKLEYLIENHQIWSEMGKAGRKFVEENFNINVLNKRLEKLYKDLLANN